MDEKLPAIAPIHFFQLRLGCYRLPKGHFPRIEGAEKTRYLLLETSELTGEIPFAKVYMGWEPEGIEFLVEVGIPFQSVSFPQVTEGDAVELMIDTRDVKTSGYNTRFCHHFFFLPASLDGIHAGEITRFRTEDSHPLCDPAGLTIRPDFGERKYSLSLYVPKETLFGYDPEQFDRLGFTYRISRVGQNPQHFSACSDEFQIEQQPSLWASFRLEQ